jgi:hypothetical protein
LFSIGRSKELVVDKATGLHIITKRVSIIYYLFIILHNVY